MNDIVRVGGPLRPTTFAEMERFAIMAAKSGMVPQQYAGKPDAIMIAVQLGSELGLAPMQSLQNIAVVGGRPSVFGDAMPGLVRASGKCAWIKETVAGDGEARIATAATLRHGDPEPIVRTFSVADAKRAGLWGKAGPWTQYTDRMLSMRARSWCLRDAYPDVLRGLMAYEEAQDIPPDAPRREPPYPGPTLDAEPLTEASPEPPRQKRRTINEFLDALQLELAACEGLDEVNALCDREDVKKAVEHFTNGAKQRLDDIIAAALDRVTGMET